MIMASFFKVSFNDTVFFEDRPLQVSIYPLNVSIKISYDTIKKTFSIFHNERQFSKYDIDKLVPLEFKDIKQIAIYSDNGQTCFSFDNMQYWETEKSWIVKSAFLVSQTFSKIKPYYTTDGVICWAPFTNPKVTLSAQVQLKNLSVLSFVDREFEGTYKVKKQETYPYSLSLIFDSCTAHINKETSHVSPFINDEPIIYYESGNKNKKASYHEGLALSFHSTGPSVIDFKFTGIENPDLELWEQRSIIVVPKGTHQLTKEDPSLITDEQIALAACSAHRYTLTPSLPPICCEVINGMSIE